MRSVSLFALAALLCCTGYAPDLTVTLQFSVLQAGPGDLVTFSGNVHNNDVDPVDLNGCDVSLFGPFQTDCQPFLDNTPFVTLAAGADTGVIDLFTIQVDSPYTAPWGTYSGLFEILGGPEVDTVLSATLFSVETVPEPGTAGFALIGIAAAIWRVRRLRAK